jgi:hypothetical protein
MPRPRALLLLLLPILLAGHACSERETEQPPAPAPLDTTAALTPQEQARAIAGDPRMLLFDLETALEGVHEASGAYPTTAEFRLDERWEFQRAALDAAFLSWEYASDGSSFRLSGTTDGRRFDIASPS